MGGCFPDYKRVIPNNNTNILNISREKLLSAVDRVSTIANEKSPVIKFKLLENILNLNTINNESSTASEDIKINYTGEDNEISINLKDNTSPITAQENSNANLVYVLMPMRV